MVVEVVFERSWWEEASVEAMPVERLCATAATGAELGVGVGFGAVATWWIDVVTAPAIRSAVIVGRDKCPVARCLLDRHCLMGEESRRGWGGSETTGAHRRRGGIGEACWRDSQEVRKKVDCAAHCSVCAHPDFAPEAVTMRDDRVGTVKMKERGCLRCAL